MMNAPDPKEKKKASGSPGKGNDQYFDMYHFFSRKDVWLAVIVLLALLIWLLFETVIMVPPVT